MYSDRGESRHGAYTALGIYTMNTKPPEKRRSHMMHVRMTKDQFARVRIAARLRGVKPSAWIRYHIDLCLQADTLDGLAFSEE